MTDAEKMREAAAQACDRIAGNTADFGRDYRRAAGQCAAMIRALPVPDASAPAAYCQQAGLVTVDAAKYGRRNVQKMIRQWDAHRTACRAEGTQAIQDTLDAMEEHIDYAYRADTVPPGLLDEVKAALRLSDIDRAMLQSMAISFRARMDFSFNPDDMADLLTRVSAALARLEREVG